MWGWYSQGAYSRDLLTAIKVVFKDERVESLLSVVMIIQATNHEKDAHYVIIL